MLSRMGVTLIMTNKSAAEILREKFMSYMYSGRNIVGNLWVFANDGKFDQVLSQHLRFPTLLTTKQPDGQVKFVVTQMIDVPKEYDLMWYAIDILRIDPISLVPEITDLDVHGAHRYYYVQLDPDNHRLIVRVAYNEKGAFSEGCYIRGGPFVQRTDVEVVYPSYAVQSFGYSDQGTLGDCMYIHDTLLDKAWVEQQKERASKIRLRGTLRCREVDWSGTLAFWKGIAGGSDELAAKIPRRLFTFAELGEIGVPSWEWLIQQPASFRRDLYFLPRNIILPDGEMKSFGKALSDIAATNEIDVYRNHLKSIREAVGKYFGPHAPGNLYVAAMEVY